MERDVFLYIRLLKALPSLEHFKAWLILKKKKKKSLAYIQSKSTNF